MEFLLPFFKWCDSTWLGETIRDSRLYFPIIETFHLFALTVLLGAVVVLNLRMCRIILRRQPVRQLALDLSPWAFWSLVVILTSGVLLFLSEALKCYASIPFQVKMVFLFSALIFHFTVHRKVTRAERDPGLVSGILVGTVSLLLWFGVGLGGRAIGFL
jgi:hypothetical protein